ncbi:MAG TPA: hypothetical protein VF491_18690 [Vicinamibacterales bacterium]|jgi:hypothetical protein
MIRIRASLLLLLAVMFLGDVRAQSTDGPVYVAYFWRAKPGMSDAYNAYIKGTAEKIDEDARKAGVFEEVVTVTPSQMGTSAAITDWTHLRIFKLKNRAAAEALGAGLDAATLRVVPDENQRKANSERSATLRDFVRQEVWTGLR